MYLIRCILDRLILVFGVIGAGCIPSFIAQFQQRVGGRLDQALKDLAPFQTIADQFHHGSLQELIQYHLSSADPTFRNEGNAIQALVDASDRLRLALHSLQTDLLRQLLYLLTKADHETMKATWVHFSPAFNLTPESMVLALIIGIAIWLLFIGCWALLDRLIRILLAR